VDRGPSTLKRTLVRGPSTLRREQLADAATNPERGTSPMPVKAKPVPGSIDPDRLYHPTELSQLCGLSRKQLVRMMDEGRIGFHIVGAERGRRIEGQQWLDWKASRRVEPTS